jgi:carbon monoxide dehydrogenase subunit G
MSLNIRESFEVRAPPLRVWQFLTDPALVVRCLPGAELIEIIYASTYRGRVNVKAGPISTAYDGMARLTEVNEETRIMRLVGEGSEVGAAGFAKLTMVGTVSNHPAGGSMVEMDATIDIAGRIMQFGRGLVESFSRQIIKQFAIAIRETLEQGEAAAMVDAARTRGAMEESASVQPNASVSALSPATETPAAVSRTSELRVMPLLWRAILGWVRRLFGRT